LLEKFTDALQNCISASDAAAIFGYIEKIDTADSVDGLIEMLSKL
jgi:hypothetical protein